MRSLKEVKYFQYLLLALACLISACSDEPAVIKKPNILFIMSDDHAMQAISAYGHPISKLAPTPNIDRLAESGAIFMSNYCTNSICGPSRASILTGKHSHKNGFMKNTNEGFDIYFNKENIWELFDLKNDPMEMDNIFGEKGTEEISKRLTSELIRLQDLYEVPEDFR